MRNTRRTITQALQWHLDSPIDASSGRTTGWRGSGDGWPHRLGAARTIDVNQPADVVIVKLSNHPESLEMSRFADALAPVPTLDATS